MPASVPTAEELAALAARVTALEGADPEPNLDAPVPPKPPVAALSLAVAPGPTPDSAVLTWEGAATGLRSRSSYDPDDHVNDLGPVTGKTSTRRGLPPGGHTWWVVGRDGVESNRVTLTTTSAPPAEPDPPAGPGPKPATTGTTLFADDFESGLSKWAALQTTPTGHDSSPQPVPGRIELVPREGGGTCCRIRRPSGDRERSELLPGDACDVKNGDVRTISVAWLFPKDFPTPRGRWFIVYQQHAGNASPAFAIEVDGQDRLVVRNNRTNDAPTVIGAIDRGVWHRYDIGVRFASDGWVEVHRDGKLVVPRTKRNTAPADYGKVGIYTDRHDVTAELFIDNFRFARP